MMNISIVFLLMAFLSAPVFAADAPDKAASRQPRACHDEVQKFCGQVKRGEGRVARCIKENEKSFSPACQAAMEKQFKQRAERTAEKHEACRADSEKFCKDKQDGSGGAIRCLRDHEKELSEDCRKSLHKRASNVERK